MSRKSLTLTVIANITSNYGEGLGNVSTIQKVYREGKNYAIRSRESLKNAIMDQSGMYNDLEVDVEKKVAQKKVSDAKNASNCRALEGGYMNTAVGENGLTYVRNSSFYLTDAVACEAFGGEARFHNNLHLAKTYAEDKGLNLQNDAEKVGLMPYNYEYNKSLKIYSLTIDLSMIGKDENFSNPEAPKKEKIERVQAIIGAVEKLELRVKGSSDNAEPIFIVGGISSRMTHVFENAVKVEKKCLKLNNELKSKIKEGYYVGLLEGENFDNELEIIKELSPISVREFFEKIKDDIRKYYEV